MGQPKGPPKSNIFWKDLPKRTGPSEPTFPWGRPDDPAPKLYELISDLEAETLPSPAWALEPVFTVDGLVVLVAPRGVGKTFLALGWSFAIAAGRPWFNRPVREGPVVYVMAEGRGGLPKRVRAQKEYLGLHGEVGVHFLTTAVPVLTKGEADRLIDSIKAAGIKPALIVLDTLSRTFGGGDENSSKDMGRYVAAIDQLKAEFGCALLVLHHTGHDNLNRERGSSVLGGAADTMVALRTMSGGALEMRCLKQKDAVEFGPVRLRLLPSGESAVLVEGGPEVLRLASVTDNELTLLKALADAFTEGGATATDWAAATGLAHSSFHAARGKLVQGGLVEHVGVGKGARYVLTTAGTQALTVHSSKLGPG